ncbi:Protein of unknown function [Flavobacterium micromati]|uniref:Outer membrane protein beta-barrel domain-containing protein n=1 Tax=Flavobacterium micromati TaxID=229205 RepID=A0A1M5GTT9_9FLAO|nr:DUF3575 domain-containing protein [Flavobacterium micromati]MCL6461241.1 DUF3575 domain-containing protein [Flavobacterium micromati]SHG07129.1 Protein of unknown function [Flavobacterium micromati]
MKKIILSAIAVMAFGFVSAQENVVKVNPLSILGGTDLVSFEHKLGENSSFVVGAGIGGFKIGDAKYSNFGGEVQYRYYFNEALRGFYAGGQAGYSAGKVEIENSFSFDDQGNMNSSTNETNFGAFKVGAKGGYQWIWESGFSLDLNLGLAYNNFNYKNSDSSFSTLKASGVLPNFGFALGYGF